VSQPSEASPPVMPELPVVVGVATVVSSTSVTPHMRRVTLTAPLFDRLDDPLGVNWQIRLYFPRPGQEVRAPVLAETINDYVGDDGDKPIPRPFTVRHFDGKARELAVDFVVHPNGGAGCAWAMGAEPGDHVGFLIPTIELGDVPDESAIDWHLMLGDDAAIPALASILHHLPAGARAHVFVEVAAAADEQPLPSSADTTITWLHRGDGAAGTCGLLERALAEFAWPEGRGYVRVISEAKEVGRMRRFLREERGLDRRSYSVSVYWRRGKSITQAFGNGVMPAPPDGEPLDMAEQWNAMMERDE
jgi:NADPH-dependent ferric siderophore reductase